MGAQRNPLLGNLWAKSTKSFWGDSLFSKEESEYAFLILHR